MKEKIIKFFRFGKPPVSGISHNFRDDSSEEGVSVYENRNGEPDFKGWYFGFLDRPCFEGEGKVVGSGSDGEPLVEIISIRKSRKPKSFFDKYR